MHGTLSLMEAANVTLRLLATSQVLLFFVVIAFSSNPLRIRVVGAALMLGIMAYLVLPLYVDLLGLGRSVPLLFLASCVPGLLLLLVWLVFEDNAPVPWWVSLGCIAIVISAALGAVEHIEAERSLQLVKLGVMALAVYVVWLGRDADLVAMRLKFRSLFIACLLILALAVIIVELVTDFAVPSTLELAGMAAIFLTSLVFNFFFVRLNPSAKLVDLPQAIPQSSDDPMMQTLLQRMVDERLYADHDLRVSGLAATLGVPEYQLRKRINQQLGFRNFNQFVNRYRIEEAGERLLKENSLPILTIALDVGFRSISSFNTSFLAHFGMSPTQYRNQHRG